MVIEKLTLLNFKNYEAAELPFSPSVNLITGPNGSGKTNLLDALHYISMTKSAFPNQDSLNVKTGADYFSIHCRIQNAEGSSLVQCNYVKGQKKSVLLDKVPYKKVSEHIGKFPMVLMTPFDTDLVREGSEGRRNFFDSLISQLYGSFLQDLIRYAQLLKQRNSLLRIFHESGHTDLHLIDYYNIEIISLAKSIYAVRKDFLREFEPLFKRFYSILSNSGEEVALEYVSQCHQEDFEKQFVSALPKDILLQRTGMGIHKDDFVFILKGFPLKGFGSQGQQKSYVIALKIAQYEIIKMKKGFMPALLLDDIFDKLDDERINTLLAMVSSGMFGQLFITDARIDRMEKYLGNISTEMSIFKIHNGKVTHG